MTGTWGGGQTGGPWVIVPPPSPPLHRGPHGTRRALQPPPGGGGGGLVVNSPGRSDACGQPPPDSHRTPMPHDDTDGGAKRADLCPVQCPQARRSEEGAGGGRSKQTGLHRDKGPRTTPRCRLRRRTAQRFSGSRPMGQRWVAVPGGRSVQRDRGQLVRVHRGARCTRGCRGGAIAAVRHTIGPPGTGLPSRARRTKGDPGGALQTGAWAHYATCARDPITIRRSHTRHTIRARAHPPPLTCACRALARILRGQKVRSTSENAQRRRYPGRQGPLVSTEPQSSETKGKSITKPCQHRRLSEWGGGEGGQEELHVLMASKKLPSPPPQTHNVRETNGPTTQAPTVDEHNAHTHTHTHTHTHDENRKQEHSEKSGERKLLRSRRAALDVLRSIDTERQSAVLDCGFSAIQNSSCALPRTTCWVRTVPTQTPRRRWCS